MEGKETNEKYDMRIMEVDCGCSWPICLWDAGEPRLGNPASTEPDYIWPNGLAALLVN